MNRRRSDEFAQRTSKQQADWTVIECRPPSVVELTAPASSATAEPSRVLHPDADTLPDRINATIQANNPVSVAFLSLGNIDWLVDRFGASVTSDLLSDVETIMAYLVRSGDAVGRLNLRCFLVILPDAKLEDATYVSNRIADVLGDTEFQIPGCADTVRLHIEASSAAWSQSIASPSPREGFVLH